MQKNVLHLFCKFLAKIFGQTISMKAVLGDIVRFKTRFLYYCVSNNASWESQIKIKADALRKIEFWQKKVLTLNRNRCFNYFVSASNVCSFFFYFDAPDVGFGVYLKVSVITRKIFLLEV